jgi:tRNA C32,U32 (ribose-2'-O)-methylase TrmJ
MAHIRPQQHGDERRRTAEPHRDLEVLVHVLREALTVIDDHDPHRNPNRCMRQIRRLLDKPTLRVAVTRLSATIPAAD